jgi:release factor glutamine methyltransferase
MSNMKLSCALKSYPKLLPDSKTSNLDVKLCITNILDCSIEELYIRDDYDLDDKEQQKILDLIARRATGEPMAYILGKKDFWDLNVHVNQDVLVPRPETELLVDEILSRFDVNTNLSVLDIGTGSGIIALCLASARDNWHILATDISSAALKVARLNAAALNLDKNLTFLQSDFFTNINSSHKFDIIVSNPPYIAETDPHLIDLSFEPKSALVSGSNGLFHLYEIIKMSREFLRSQGCLLLEHGWQQGQQVRDCLKKHGYINICTKNDYSELERVTLAFSP